MAENIGSQNLEERRRQRHESRQTQTWTFFLRDLCEATKLDEKTAEKAASSVLCALEQRIFRDEAKDLNAQLPQKLTKMLQRCERHEGLRARDIDRKKFVEMVCEDLGKNEQEAESIIRAVLQTVRAHVSEGEVDQVIGMLPHDLREFWQPTV